MKINKLRKADTHFVIFVFGIIHGDRNDGSWPEELRNLCPSIGDFLVNRVLVFGDQKNESVVQEVFRAGQLARDNVFQSSRPETQNQLGYSHFFLLLPVQLSSTIDCFRYQCVMILFRYFMSRATTVDDTGAVVVVPRQNHLLLLIVTYISIMLLPFGISENQNVEVVAENSIFL